MEVGETWPPAVGRTGGREREEEERTLERREKSARAADFTGIETEREGETEDPFSEAIGASKIKYLLLSLLQTASTLLVLCIVFRPSRPSSS